VAEFTHLHVHSEYSLLDGQSRLDRLIEQTKAGGMSALALTDHGGMYGSIEFYKKAREAGIKPILGEEAYLAPNLEERGARYDYNHLLLLARDLTGYHNLLKLTTIAHTKGYHSRPRVDKKVLAEHASGLIVTSGCISGEIPDLLRKDDLNGARMALNWYREVFGTENFYLEIQDHLAADSPQAQINQHLYALHKETGVPLLATNDLHYVNAKDAEAQDVLLCVQTGKTVDEPKRMKFDSSEYYLKTPAEMERLFPDVPDALRNTMRVAEQCDVEIEFGRQLQPDYPIPSAFATQLDYLRHLCDEGVRERFGAMSDMVRQRLDYELGIIESKGFVWYFLVVWDFVHHARGKGIRCSARGSGAGSLVGYVLGITTVDPLRYDLLFERFLNPERMSMPDLDMDFPDDRREEVIEYVANKYGWDNVGQIVTFNTMAAKAAIRDVGRVMGMQSEADRVARLIPSGPKVTITSAMNEVRDLRQSADQNPATRKLMDMALQLEGTVRSTGIHAAGVVISRERLEDVVPLQLRDYKDPKSWLVSQYEQAHLEELGLLKMDFLGLSNLTILQNCQRFVAETRGITLDLDRLPVDDARTYELLASGETTGVFQLESGAMRSYIKELKPNCLEDLTAMVALYRPGPMESIPRFIKAKHGEIQIKYLHPDLEPFLRESYGVIVYQDQVLQIAVNLAGFSWGEVDKFRKAMGKKIPEVLKAYREKFIHGCEARGISRKIADDIFTLIEPFGGYGFNKAHACSYAWVAYQTAYLKANYTAEFMAATLTTEAGDAKKVIAAVGECRRMGVEVLPPDINQSGGGFSVELLPEGRAVRFGLQAIKNVGPRPIEELLEARRTGGDFASLADVTARTDSKAVTRGALECLIKAGALDSLGRRSQLLAALDRAVALGAQLRRAREVGQNSLFGGASGEPTSADFTLPDVPDHPQQQILAWEKDLLNLYLSVHPLAHVAAALKRRVTTWAVNLNEEWAGQTVTLGGRVASVRVIRTKKGDSMAAVQLEDVLGTIEVVVFPKAYQASAKMWHEDALVLVTGTVKLRDDEPQLACESVEELVISDEEMNRRRFQLRINMARTPNDMVDRVHVQDVLTLLRKFPGEDTYDLVVRNGAWTAHLQPRAGDAGIAFSPQLQQQLEALLGPNTVEARSLPPAGG
jgi:DNA polymerase III subunit alpha